MQELEEQAQNKLEKQKERMWEQLITREQEKQERDKRRLESALLQETLVSDSISLL